MASKRDIVQAPSFTPAPYGLMSVANMPTDGTNRWMNGVQFQAPYCGPIEVTSNACVTGVGVAKVPLDGGLPIRGADAFTVYAWINCSVVGYTEAEGREHAMSALTNNEPMMVEEVFWTGGPNDVHPHLAADVAVTDTVSTPTGQEVTVQTAASVVASGVGIPQGVGELEAALGSCYGGVGVLHIPKNAVAPFADRMQLVTKGQQLTTMSGNLVAAGNGYDGSSPSGSPPPDGYVWAYITGAVDIRRSSPKAYATYTQSVNRTNNDLVYIVERTYVIAWGCCHFAALINLNDCCAVDGGGA